MPRTDGKATGVPEARAMARSRVQAVSEAARGRLKGGSWSTRTRHGTVTIADLQTGKEGDVHWVDVRLGGSPTGGDPSFRIYNPPTLVEDPAGALAIGARRYRQDPLQAVAEVIAMNGGAEPTRKIRGRRGQR